MKVPSRIASALGQFLDDFDAAPETTERGYAEYWQRHQELPTIGELVQIADFNVLARRVAIAPRPPRTTHPVRIPNAFRLSDQDPVTLDAVNVVNAFKSSPRLMRRLREVRIDHEHGPRRGDGDFGLLYLANVHSGEPRLHRWWRQVRGNHSLWKACGFDGPCSYQLLSERFAELEQFAHVFERMKNELVQMARRQEPMIGAYITVDGTECQSHSRLHHACPPGFACPDLNKPRKARAHSLTPDAATAQRQAATDLSAEEAEELFAIQSRVVRFSSLSGAPEDGLRVQMPDGTVLRAWHGHLYSCRDSDAGFRTYENKSHWYGFMHVKAVDVATGVPLAAVAIPASVSEFKSLPDLFDRTVLATGIKPIAVGADRGYGFREVHEFLAANDSGAVIPYRIPGRNGAREPQETDYADIHGVPKCRCCGLPGDIVKAQGGDGGAGRIYFTCPLKPFDECKGRQSISTSKDPLQLVLTPRTSPIYGSVRAASQTNEQAHQFMRERFAVGGKTLSDRLRRVGLPAQQLRSDAALAITWLLVVRRLGWLGVPLDERQPVVTKPLPLGRYTKGVRNTRRRLSLFGGSAPVRGAPSEHATA